MTLLAKMSSAVFPAQSTVCSICRGDGTGKEKIMSTDTVWLVRGKHAGVSYEMGRKSPCKPRAIPGSSSTAAFTLTGEVTQFFYHAPQLF